MIATLVVVTALWGQKPVTGFKPGPPMDRIEPGQLITDPPTLENLGFRWYIRGDSNRNASVAVSYRPAGTSRWRQALPLLRIHHELINQDYEPYRTGNLFAGSVMFLDSGRTYEVRLTMRDPDGGAAAPRTLRVRTRQEPAAFAGGRTLEVYPKGHRGEKPAGAHDGLAAALDAATAGDILLLHGGIYHFDETLVIAKSGAPGKPIVIRGGPGGGAILEGAGHATGLLDIQNADYLMFEHLTFRNAGTALIAGKKNGPGASHLTVRHCRIENVIRGINSTSERSENWYIADNVMVGTNPTWFPRPRGTYMSPSHTGVNLYGRGHVVAHNRITRFSDSLAIANYGPPPDDLSLQPVAIDFYNNDLSYSQDDSIETDYGAHNVRVYRNRCYNTHTGLSVQPFYGGPVYLIRNELYAVTALNFKLHNYSAGIVAYHNTAAGATTGFLSFNKWQNGHFRNNLILGGRDFQRPDGSVRAAYAINTGTLTPYSTLDYNGYRRNIPGDLIRWFDGVQVAIYRTLGAFTDATGHERHGRMLDYDVFQGAPPPEPWTSYDTAEYDLRLRAGSAAVDAGAVLPNVNDDFAGDGPDLGCYELGRAAVLFGPRWRSGR